MFLYIVQAERAVALYGLYARWPARIAHCVHVDGLFACSNCSIAVCRLRRRRWAPSDEIALMGNGFLMRWERGGTDRRFIYSFTLVSFRRRFAKQAAERGDGRGNERGNVRPGGGPEI